MTKLLRRKIDAFLAQWRGDADRKPLIVKGARQVGKTSSVCAFAREHYRSFIHVNFVEQPACRQIFADGYQVERIVRNLSLLLPTAEFVEGDTLFFFDELQACPACATALKFFKIDGRFDVICSGSLMGINYHEIESNSVGYKEDYLMHSMDFEEFLWAMGYAPSVVDGLLGHMLEARPFSELEMQRFGTLFRDYVTLGGMPDVVRTYVAQGHFGGCLQIQRQLLTDYGEDITKYARGLDKAKVMAVYRHLSVFLARENKKFQISKIARGARNREYVGCVEWLTDAGVVNPCYCLSTLELPLRGNYDASSYKLYFKDTGLLVASLDEEAQEDLRARRNLGTYKGALYENVVADMLVKQGYALYYYRHDKPSLDMDFFVCDAESLIPVEVKASMGASPSLRRLLSGHYADIRFGIKFCQGNVEWGGQAYTFPHFTAFLLKRFLRERPGFPGFGG